MLEPGSFVHFIKDGDRLFLYVDREQDGYPIKYAASIRKKTTYVSSRDLCREILRTLKRPAGKRYRATIHEMGGTLPNLYELSFLN